MDYFEYSEYSIIWKSIEHVVGSNRSKFLVTEKIGEKDFGRVLWPKSVNYKIGVDALGRMKHFLGRVYGSRELGSCIF